MIDLGAFGGDPLVESETTVLLKFNDGRPAEFVEGVHIHGIRDGRLLLARGEPGGGVDAEVVLRVPLAELSFAETCPGLADDERDPDPGGICTSRRGEHLIVLGPLMIERS